MKKYTKTYRELIEERNKLILESYATIGGSSERRGLFDIIWDSVSSGLGALKDNTYGRLMIINQTDKLDDLLEKALNETLTDDIVTTFNDVTKEIKDNPEDFEEDSKDENSKESKDDKKEDKEDLKDDKKEDKEDLKDDKKEDKKDKKIVKTDFEKIYGLELTDNIKKNAPIIDRSIKNLFSTQKGPTITSNYLKDLKSDKKDLKSGIFNLYFEIYDFIKGKKSSTMGDIKITEAIDNKTALSVAEKIARWTKLNQSLYNANYIGELGNYGKLLSAQLKSIKPVISAFDAITEAGIKPTNLDDLKQKLSIKNISQIKNILTNIGDKQKVDELDKIENEPEKKEKMIELVISSLLSLLIRNLENMISIISDIEVRQASVKESHIINEGILDIFKKASITRHSDRPFKIEGLAEKVQAITPYITTDGMIIKDCPDELKKILQNIKVDIASKVSKGLKNEIKFITNSAAHFYNDIKFTGERGDYENIKVKPKRVLIQLWENNLNEIKAKFGGYFDFTSDELTKALTPSKNFGGTEVADGVGKDDAKTKELVTKIEKLDESIKKLTSGKITTSFNKGKKYLRICNGGIYILTFIDSYAEKSQRFNQFISNGYFKLDKDSLEPISSDNYWKKILTPDNYEKEHRAIIITSKVGDILFSYNSKGLPVGIDGNICDEKGLTDYYKTVKAITNPTNNVPKKDINFFILKKDEKNIEFYEFIVTDEKKSKEVDKLNNNNTIDWNRVKYTHNNIWENSQF